jgi:type IV secretion system protein VirB2
MSTKEFEMKSKNVTTIALLATAFVIASVDIASAQQFQPIQNAVNSVLQFLTGSFATTSATLAVAAVGFLALTSRIPWFWAFAVVVGVALIFGSSQIVSTLQGGLGG